MFDHYVYKENSLAAFVYNQNKQIADFATWYFVYILELVIRINFLKKCGVMLNQGAIDYALDSINDWIIFVNILGRYCEMLGIYCEMLDLLKFVNEWVIFVNI